MALLGALEEAEHLIGPDLDGALLPGLAPGFVPQRSGSLPPAAADDLAAERPLLCLDRHIMVLLVAEQDDVVRRAPVPRSDQVGIVYELVLAQRRPPLDLDEHADRVARARRLDEHVGLAPAPLGPP